MKRPKQSTDASSKSVFIVEDHPVFRQGLTHLINREKDLRVCGQAESAELAFPAIGRLKPDVVLVDISLPGKSGLDLIKQLRGVNRRIKLLVVSMHDEALYADRVLRLGGDGYIMKQEDPEEIIDAIRDILSGHIYVSEAVMASLPKAAPKRTAEAEVRLIDQLTDQELEILELVGLGKNARQIARQLRLESRAVSARLAEMRKKLRLKSANELLRYAVCWVETDGA